MNSIGVNTNKYVLVNSINTLELRTKSLDFDFIYDSKNNPYVVEFSYCYVAGDSYDSCPGYWDSDLNWHDEAVNPQHFIINNFIKSLSIDL